MSVRRIAIYRMLYGEDFVQESISSILPYVDRVIVCKAERPWGSSTGVMWNGEWVEWPKEFDKSREKIASMNEPRVEVIDDWWHRPQDQYEHILRDIVRPRFPELTEYVTMEPDWVFEDEQARGFFAGNGFGKLTCSQIELWRTPAWIIPYRQRATPTRHTLAKQDNADYLGDVHNLGFCVSDRSMYWKHLTACAFAAEIKDSPPNPRWLDVKWRNWTPDTRDLEISIGCERNITHAEPYNVSLLPASIQKRYNDGEWKDREP